MSSHHRRHPNRTQDSLVQFLHDVARLPVIRSKYKYLPLVRQNRRGVLLRRLGGSATPTTFERLQHELADHHAALTDFSQASGRPPLDLAALALEIDPYLTDADITQPHALFAAIGWYPPTSDESRRLLRRAWRFLYLLALLPPEDRSNHRPCSLTPAVAAHFASVEHEATAARRRLVEGFMRYPLKIAREFIGRDVDYLDLVQQGVVGLMEAVDIYREQHKLSFLHFPRFHIYQTINTYVLNNTTVFHLPQNMQDEAHHTARLFAKVTDSLGYEPTDREFAVSQGWMTQAQFDAMDLVPRRAVAESKLARFVNLVKNARTPERVSGVYDRHALGKLVCERAKLRQRLHRRPSQTTSNVLPKMPVASGPCSRCVSRRFTV